MGIAVRQAVIKLAVPSPKNLTGTKKALAVNAKCLIFIACLGRGKLNDSGNFLISDVKRDFYFRLEYQLEYRSVENCFAQDYSEVPVEYRAGKNGHCRKCREYLCAVSASLAAGYAVDSRPYRGGPRS